jgi:hypothetical protein
MSSYLSKMSKAEPFGLLVTEFEKSLGKNRISIYAKNSTDFCVLL